VSVSKPPPSPPPALEGTEYRQQSSRASRGARARRSVRLASDWLNAVAGAVSWLGLFVSIAALFVMFLYTTISVLGRYTGWFTVLGADEISSYMLATLFFLGLGHTFRAGAFIRVGTIYDRIRPGSRRLLDVAFYTLALAAAAIMTYYFWQFVSDSISFGTMSIGVPQVRLYIPQLALGVGMSMFTLQVGAGWLTAAAALLQSRPGSDER
jgi:TRAP-type C4-dicarboxylate transport system permease small subunit